MEPIDVAVVGCGYWGPNLLRALMETPEARVIAVCDRDPARLEYVRWRHPQIGLLTRELSDVLALGPTAVVVSTPPQTHYGIVRLFLEHGVDVFVEKPLATSVVDARELVALAENHERVLMVGHIGAYNPAVRMLKEMIDSGELGEIAYIDAVRGGLGLFNPTLNVIWDLAPHDIAILMYLLDEQPESASTRGIACVEHSIEDVAYVTMTFPSGVLAHARLSWLDPCKSRRITVVGRKKMVVYDDLESHEKLKIYDKSVNAVRRTDTFGEHQFAYHYGNVMSPYIHHEEPLRVECAHFLECVATREPPLTGGPNGLAVVEVIDAAQRSLRARGAVVEVVKAHEAVDDKVIDLTGVERARDGTAIAEPVASELDAS